MNKYEVQARVTTVRSKLSEYLPKLINCILDTISFGFYTIALLWILLSSVLALGILYIGAGSNYIKERINNE